MRVLLVSHTCMSRTDGHPKLHRLGSYPDVELTALVPDRMCFYGEWMEADPSDDPAFRYVVGRVRGQWVRHQWYLMFYPRALARVLREVRPDIVDLWHEPWSVVSAQATWLTRRLAPTARIVVETEQNILRRLPPPFARLQSYVLGHADAVLARSAGAADVARRKGFTGPVRVVGNAVDPDLFRPSDRAEARRRLGLGRGFLVGYVGRLAAGKGLLDLVDALARCPDDVGLVLAGSGPDEDEVRRRAHAAGLAGRVTFLPRRPREELTTVMNALDALALVSRSTPTWKEQFGRVIVEAHACAVPVIGSDSGAIPEVVGEGGLIVPEGDPAAVAAAIGRLRDDPGLAGRLGAAGRRQVEERWTWERVAAQTRDLYLDVLGHGERPPDEDALA